MFDEKSAVVSYFGDKQYLPNVSWMKNGSIMKLCATFDVPMLECAKCILPCSFMNEYDPNLTILCEGEYLVNSEFKKRYPNATTSDTRCNMSFVGEIQLAFPMNQKRRFVNACSLEYNTTKNQIMFIHKPYECNTHLPKNYYEMRDFGLFMFTALGDHRTMFTHVHLLNCG